MRRRSLARPASLLGLILALAGSVIAAAQASLPSSTLHYRDFTLRFAADGAFALQGAGWPPFNGTWTREGSEVRVSTTGGPPACAGPGRYRFTIEGARVTLAVVSDECTPRRMVLHASVWYPEGEAPPVPERRIVRNHISYRAPITIDARLKPGFPKELTCREDIADLVNRRWKEYFPSGRVEMGDAERGHLD